MVTTINKPCCGGRRLIVTACLAVVALVATACGNGEPSADEARGKLMEQLTGSGFSTPVANCVVDRALERFEPGELVNSTGNATADVDAALGIIVGECSPPETTTATTGNGTTVNGTTANGTTDPGTTDGVTTIPVTTVPTTTVAATVPDVDLTAFCAASEDVFIGLLAGDDFEAPAPATMEAFFAEIIDRIELAIVTAPSSEFATQPNELLEAIQSFDAVLADSGYDVRLVPEEELADESDVVDRARTELESFLANCDTGTDIDAERSALADELIALGDSQVTPGEGGTRAAESVELRISSDVPADWTSELGERIDERRIFVVGTDAEEFTTSWGVDGVRITALDDTEDYVALMDEADAARECALLVEEDYVGPRYTGKLRRYEGCGQDTEAVVVGANSTGGEGTVLIELQMIEFEQSVLDLITNSFAVGP